LYVGGDGEIWLRGRGIGMGVETPLASMGGGEYEGVVCGSL